MATVLARGGFSQAEHLGTDSQPCLLLPYKRTAAGDKSMARAALRSSWLGVVLVLSTPIGMAQSPTVTRFEQSDSRIAYTGTWYPNSDAPSSAGSAVLANLKGSKA